MIGLRCGAVSRFSAMLGVVRPPFSSSFPHSYLGYERTYTTYSTIWINPRQRKREELVLVSIRSWSLF